MFANLAPRRKRKHMNSCTDLIVRRRYSSRVPKFGADAGTILGSDRAPGRCATASQPLTAAFEIATRLHGVGGRGKLLVLRRERKCVLHEMVPRGILFCREDGER